VHLLGSPPRYYGHWLMDFLPRLRSLQAHPDFEAASFLVEADMPQSHYEALELVLGRTPRLVSVESDCAVTAETLLFAGPDVFFPHRVWFGAPGVPTIAPSSADAMKFLRDRLARQLQLGESHGGERLFVRRHSSVRHLVNQDALCELLVRGWGFQELRPEALSFTEQVSHFSRAEVVVGAQGSGLTNATFCAPGAKIITLCTGYAGNYPSWAQALGEMGVRHLFVTGRGLQDSHSLRHHWDFEVNPRVLEATLEELLGSGI